MKTAHQSHVAFYLIGRQVTAEPDSTRDLDLRPALFAGFRKLAKLRYDFPLVLSRDGQGDAAVRSLTHLFDDAIEANREGPAWDHLRNHALRLEQEIRLLLAEGATGTLSTLWSMATNRLSTSADGPLRDNLKRLRMILKSDGMVVDCDKAMPARLIEHVWRAVQEEKNRTSRAKIERLILKLSDILRADYVGSVAGRSAANLKASLGSVHADVFDFAIMSRLLTSGSRQNSLPKTRSQRIRWLLSVLRSQRFFPVNGETNKGPDGAQAYSFIFENCAAALDSYRKRLPKAVELAKAIAMAELESEGEYSEPRHDPLFAAVGGNDLDPRDASSFPDYLVCLDAAEMSPSEKDGLANILGAGLPMKILVQTDDLLEKSPVGDGSFAVGLRARQLASSAIALGGVYVLQSSSASLFRLRDRIHRGLSYGGPALFSIFSGATGNAGDLPAYLVAAGATESRAFPVSVYDPSAGPDWASRFCIKDNPQADVDWPVHNLAFEDEAHQRISETVAFTLVDFLACDRRCAGNFARMPRSEWNNDLVPVADYVADMPKSVPESVPYLFMIDPDDRLHKLIIDGKLIQAALRCAEMWHSLQELGGIHNSHAVRLLDQERKSWEARLRSDPDGCGNRVASAEAPPASGPPEVVGKDDEPEVERPTDEPYIETPRCTTCNECTQINDKMFSYNADKQAIIANLDAGTYRQLVEAAESCQVSIIHPGRPQNPGEPGIEELTKRAEPFL